MNRNFYSEDYTVTKSTLYRFNERVFGPAYAPYYDAYKGHTFQIDHVSPQDETGEHVWVICVSDPAIKVNGYVDLHDLVLIETIE